MSHKNSLSLPSLLIYAAPGLAFAMPTIPLYVLLPTFYAQNVGLGLAVTGVILAVARGLDVFTDPIIGILSDHVSSRWGRRKPWIIAGAIISAFAIVQLFQPPEGAGQFYLLGWIIAMYLGWTLLAVPYMAWGAELSDDYHERSRITGFREGAMILGILLAGSIPAAVVGLGQTEREGLATVAWLAVGIGLPTVALLIWRTPDRPVTSLQDRNQLWSNWREHAGIFRNKAFVRVLSGWFINGLANGLPAVLFPLYLQFALQASEIETNVLIMVYFLAGVVAIPAWVWLSRKFGKHHVWCAAMLLACAAFVWVPLLEAGAIGAFFVICVITGMAFGADLALPPAIQADVVDLDSLRTGQRRAGWYFAVWSMGTKLALAAAVGFAFPVLSLFGFDTAGNNDATAILALTVIYALIPTGLKLIAIAVMWGHPLDARRQKIIRRRLDTLGQRA